jgi:anthranilate synthase/aminodeoxychorismate synthase-like glutamine amidotransferase
MTARKKTKLGKTAAGKKAAGRSRGLPGQSTRRQATASPRAASPVVVVDNYDSFTWNLVQYLGSLGAEVEVYRNDAISVTALGRRRPRGIVISPGPGSPEDSGISRDVIRRFNGRVPILGVCLGHQAIADVFGARIVRASTVMHGKTSRIIHDGRGIYRGIENPFVATRYHSLVVERESVPETLEVTSSTSDAVIMGLKVKDADTWGVQFHPESILTRPGKDLLRNFLDLCSV